ncbi:MAG: type II toxin-antitoxin system death-on-curing family toxin [Magnetococcales bacterium]|nr:type II toxin-antitoxin system death-on-curing family toxin [Magnetococcales bacterium]
MSTPIWVLRQTVLAIHNRQLAEHGGPPGLRDEGLLDSALARPENLLVYSDIKPSIERLAAAYAYGIIRNHPFVDGNKRVAYVVCLLFLKLNGRSIKLSDLEKYNAFMALADGGMTEEAFAQFLLSKSFPN